MNNTRTLTPVFDRIIARCAADKMTRVHLTDASYKALIPNDDPESPVKLEVEGWTGSREDNGKYKRTYNYGGVYITNLWAPNKTGEFWVTDEVAEKYYDKSASKPRQYLTLDFDPSTQVPVEA